ncbi:hypothetical protein RHMOL_Rhmol02G0291600 [Rhododendron molle]|uniref:Uncharacterized protein n=1 Tax=Rhododendron molle TaxID=49168 RepID=A0ACC0PYJ6_RHOML|nr:hypothetical protein RHMOL_Rhmol02G0291600 [Rhododendron molle]
MALSVENSDGVSWLPAAKGFSVVQHGIPLESVILKWMTVPPHQLFGETECSKVVFHLMAMLPKEVSHYRRLRLWGLGIDDSCVFRNQQLENHDPFGVFPESSETRPEISPLSSELSNKSQGGRLCICINCSINDGDRLVDEDAMEY